MDTGQVVESVKKYWPWALGIVAVGYLLTRGGGSSDASAVSGTTPEELALMQQNAQIGGQISQTQIATNSAENIRAIDAIRDFNIGLVQMSTDFFATELAAYEADKQVVVGVSNAASQYAVANAQALGAAQASYNQAIGNMGAAVGAIAQGAGTIVSSVAAANAATAGAFASVLTGGISAFYSQPANAVAASTAPRAPMIDGNAVTWT
jgi:hypothetical protein